MITAIILHYYPERKSYLPEVVNFLNQGEVKPDKVVIWNNNPDYNLEKIEGTIIINSGVNLGCGIRHLIGLAFKSDFYFFQDDDLLVNPQTLKNMVARAEEFSEAIIGNEYYANGIALGRLHLCRAKHLIKDMDFMIEKDITLPFRTDDIMLSLANEKKVLLAYAPIENLSENGVGLSHTGGHAQERREFLSKYDLK